MFLNFDKALHITDCSFIKKLKKMNNTHLQRQADSVRQNIWGLIDDLIAEIEELERDKDIMQEFKVLSSLSPTLKTLR